MKGVRHQIIFVVLCTLLLSMIAGVTVGFAAGEWPVAGQGVMLIQENPPDFTDLSAVLTWLAGVGGPYFVGWVLSLVAENWRQWHSLPRPVKFLAPLIASTLVAILATLALQQTAVLNIVSPWYTIIAGAVLGYLGTQQAYLHAKQAGYAQKARE